MIDVLGGLIGGGILVGVAAVWRAYNESRRSKAAGRAADIHAAADEAGILGPYRAEIEALRAELDTEKLQRLTDMRWWGEQVNRLEDRVATLTALIAAEGVTVPAWER